jgi:hypothetical protein
MRDVKRPRRAVKPDQLKRWIAFLHNHNDVVATMDILTEHTASIRELN